MNGAQLNLSFSLTQLGWQSCFQQQLTLDECESVVPARITEQHKSVITLATTDGQFDLTLSPSMPELVVGDWVLLDNDSKFLRLLDRKTCFVRKAAGSKINKQLISANVDTAFIVTSMNADFNLNRIERFITLIADTGADVVVILTKSDQASDPSMYTEQVQSLDNMLMVEAVNCLDSACVKQLAPWLSVGNTIVMLGSSGVGKSTLTNTLLASNTQNTAEIREDDSKGRHTTTSRSLQILPAGGLILDTPGMREIQLTDCKQGIANTFSDIELLAQNCRFNNCQHTTEPGCAVLSALEIGELDERRLMNYHKLRREEAHNSASLAERRASDKALGQYYKTTQLKASKLKGR